MAGPQLFQNWTCTIVQCRQSRVRPKSGCKLQTDQIGGGKSRISLGNQLSYVNDNAALIYSTMCNALTDDTVLSKDQ